MKARAIRHRREYQSRLERLRAEYPVLLRVLGERRFEELALDDPGLTRLPAEIAPGPGRGDGVDEPALIVDLARLESAFNEVFFDTETASRLDPRALREIPAEDFARARLATVASSRLLALRYPVVAYFQAVKSGVALPPPAPRETFALLTRSRDAVEIHEISRREFVVLGLLKRGETVADALAVIDSGDGKEALLGTDARNWIESWAERGLFGSISI